MNRRASNSRKSPRAPATAPGQLLGYGLQYTRLTAMLLDGEPGTSCSLEVLDDVGQETKEGGKKLVQTKSAGAANPVADHAIPLWKTFFNWLELIKPRLVDPKSTTFELYVSREVGGPIVEAFHLAQSLEEASEAFLFARGRLWGPAPAFSAKKRLPAELAYYVNNTLEADNEHLLPLIVNFRLVCGKGSPQSDIERLIRKGAVSESHVFDVADKLCGWVKRTADKLLEQGKPAVIPHEDFHREYVAYVRAVDREAVLHSWAKKPREAEKLERLPDPFVQQLDLIECTYDEKLAAISDFLMAAWDRTNWSKSGDVHEDSFDLLNDELTRAWGHLGTMAELQMAGRGPVAHGKFLHAQCMAHKTTLQGMQLTAGHFIPGCFHALADDSVIGWHPDYAKLIKRLASQ
jgi:hypothetical protein